MRALEGRVRDGQDEEDEQYQADVDERVHVEVCVVGLSSPCGSCRARPPAKVGCVSIGCQSGVERPLHLIGGEEVAIAQPGATDSSLGSV